MMKQTMSGATVLAIVLGMPIFMVLMALLTGSPAKNKNPEGFPGNGSVEIMQDWMSEDYGPPKVLESPGSKAKASVDTPAGAATAAEVASDATASDSDLGAGNPHIPIIEPESPAGALPAGSVGGLSESTPTTSSSTSSETAASSTSGRSRSSDGGRGSGGDGFGSNDGFGSSGDGFGGDGDGFDDGAVASYFGGNPPGLPSNLDDGSFFPEIVASLGDAFGPVPSPAADTGTGEYAVQEGAGHGVAATSTESVLLSSQSSTALEPLEDGGMPQGMEVGAEDALQCTRECCNGRWRALLLLHIPASGGFELFAAVRDALARAAQADNGGAGLAARQRVTTCRTVHRTRMAVGESRRAEAAAEVAGANDPNMFDHIPVDKPTIMRAVQTVNNVFPRTCQFLRMEYDVSFVDLALAARARDRLGLLTMMRHPVDRLAALYLSSAIAKKVSFHDFVSGHFRHARVYSGFNHMAKMLAGTWPESSLYKPDKQAQLNDALLDVAKTNLARMCFGIYEIMDDSARFLTHVYGVEVALRKDKSWGYTGEDVDAASEGPIPRMILSESDANLVLELHAVDVELYHFAVQLFAARYRALFAADPRPARPAFEYVMGKLGAGDWKGGHIAVSDADEITFGSSFTHGLKDNDLPLRTPALTATRPYRAKGRAG
eukprot:jgi/Mesvir1/6801/Mv09001-RA.1